jgi:hypothetical protein
VTTGYFCRMKAPFPHPLIEAILCFLVPEIDNIASISSTSNSHYSWQVYSVSTSHVFAAPSFGSRLPQHWGAASHDRHLPLYSRRHTTGPLCTSYYPCEKPQSLSGMTTYPFGEDGQAIFAQMHRHSCSTCGCPLFRSSVDRERAQYAEPGIVVGQPVK